MKRLWWNSNTYYEKISTIFFYISLIIILFQSIGQGARLLQTESYFVAFKILNFIFGCFSVFISVYLFIKEKVAFKRVIKAGFLGLSIFFLIAALQWLIDKNFLPIDSRGNVLLFSVFIAFLSISQRINNISHSGLHSAVIFVLSFVMLILCGSFLLMLPASTTTGIRPLDAVFTITSGVTVTGLAVVDTQTTFTYFGKTVILVFIQLGGLGILTFTNLFSLLFKSDNSFQNRLMVSDMIKELNNRDTFSTLGKIIILTLVVEMLGALLIYISIYNTPDIDNAAFFSVFHSISAFCNAGFSTLSNGLYQSNIKFNYFLHTIIAWLIITGGISYSVMLNHNALIGKRVDRLFCALGYKTPAAGNVKMNTNNSLIIRTTVFLLIFGTIVFYINEYDNVLKEHGFWGKIFVSFFNSVTPRTAGFNNVDMAALTMPTLLICIFLMWVGASPGSTGGGIKTTTFAVVCMNLFNQIKGRTKLIYKWREIPVESINQANAVIFLSLIAIGISVLFMSYFEKNMLFRDLLYEVVSAYSTVGLSLGITPKLTDSSKIVLIITMFIGRVSFLTFLIGLYRQFFKEHRKELAKYPSDNVFIN